MLRGGPTGTPRRTGKTEYLKGIFGTPKEAAINELLREKYAYQSILRDAERFTPEELIGAKEYYLEHLKKAMKKKVEIISDYIVKHKS